MHLDLMRDTSISFQIEAPDSIHTMRIWHCKYKTFAPISRCINLEVLSIAGFPDETLEILSSLTNLKHLSIVHLPKVSDLAPLASLMALVSLSLSTLPSWDASGKVTIVKSLNPITKLPNLRHLELFGIQSEDKSLSSLYSCTNLVSACFSKYPKKEIDDFFSNTGVENTHNPELIFKA